MDQNLRKFEAITLGSLLLGLVIGALRINQFATDFQSAATIFGFELVIIALVAVLVLLISRKRSKVAKWLWLVLYVVGLFFYIPQLGQMVQEGLVGTLSLAQLGMQLIGMYYLFLKKSA